MASDLIATMLGFGAVVRPYMAAELSKAAGPGLTERDIAILEFIADREQTTFAEIAEHVPFAEHFRLQRQAGASSSRLSAAVAALFSEQGVIRKDVNPKNQRQAIVTLTAKGRQILDRVAETRARVYDEIRKAMELDNAHEAELAGIFERGAKNFRAFLAVK